MSSIICYSNVLCMRQSNVVCVCHSSVLCICHSNVVWPLWFCHYNFLCILFVVAFLLLIFQFSLQCNYRHHRFSVACDGLMLGWPVTLQLLYCIGCIVLHLANFKAPFMHAAFRRDSKRKRRICDEREPNRSIRGDSGAD